jgi:hypothetical protein
MARIETVAPGEARGLRRLVAAAQQGGLRVRADDHPGVSPTDVRSPFRLEDVTWES